MKTTVLIILTVTVLIVGVLAVPLQERAPRLVRFDVQSQEYPEGMWRLNHSFLKVLIGRNVHIVASDLAWRGRTKEHDDAVDRGPFDRKSVQP